MTRAAERESQGMSERRGPRTAREAWAAEGLQTLAAADADWAAIRNDSGFSKTDTYLGHALAHLMQGGLDDRAWGLAQAVCARYWRQVGRPPANGDDAHGADRSADR